MYVYVHVMCMYIEFVTLKVGWVGQSTARPDYDVIVVAKNMWY